MSAQVMPPPETAGDRFYTYYCRVDAYDQGCEAAYMWPVAWSQPTRCQACGLFRPHTPELDSLPSYSLEHCWNRLTAGAERLRSQEAS